MSEPVDHHYLPIFYLKQWASDDGRVVRYHRPQSRVVAHRIAPSKTGYEPALYALEGYPPDKRNAIEKQFMSPLVDQPASEALQVLLAQDNSKLTHELRLGWTRFLMSLRLRNPHMVAEVTQKAKNILRQSLVAEPKEYEAVKHKTDPATFVEWVEKNTPAVIENAGKLLLPGLIDNENIGNAILKLKWFTTEVRGSFDLLTSDNPFFMSHGLADDRCLVALPISPRFVFFATKKAETLDAVMSHGVSIVSASLNQSMITQARKHVYGSNDRHLRFVGNRFRR
jgi:hypothetical protein